MDEVRPMSGEGTGFPRVGPSRLSPVVGWQLTWLEMKRVARGWRWRALVIVAAFGAFWWRRQGFGPGRPVFFPLGVSGLIGFSALFGVAAALLGVDAISQVQRGRATRLFDTRPLPDIVLAAARWVACFFLVAAASAGFLGEVLILSHLLEQACAPSPLLGWWMLWWVPGIAVASATGFAVRSWVRNDAASILLSVALLLGFGAFGWRVLIPGSIFDNFAPHLGLILPWGYALSDTGRLLLVAFGGVGIAALGQRRWMPRTPVHPGPPYRRQPFPTFRQILFPFRQWLFTDRVTGVAALALLVAGLAGVPHWVEEWQFLHLSQSQWSAVASPLPPGLASQSQPRWKILHLDADLGNSGSSSPHFTLIVENPTSHTLRWGSVSLSVAWDNVRADGRGRDAHPGPVPGTWIFSWQPPLPPETTGTLELTATPRKGSERLHAWVWNGRYSEWGRLGAWWPRANGFDLMNRRVVIPDQPVRYRLTLAKTGTGRPVCGSARVEDHGARWELVSTFPASRIMPVIANFVTVEQSFEGLPVRLEVFPRHEALAKFLFNLWGDRFRRLRRALGLPPAPFVFHEAAVAPAFHDPFALPSAELDSLADGMANIDSDEENTYPQFNHAFGPWQAGILSTWVDSAEGVPSEPYLLRDSLVTYLQDIAFNRGLQPPPRRMREQANAVLPFDLWRGRPNGPLPFDFRDSDLPDLRRPWDENTAPSGREDRVERRRAESFHHVVRYLLGDEAYAAFLQDLLSRPAGRTLTRDRYLALADRQTSRSLEPVVRQLLGPARLPTFEVRGARVFLDRNKKTRNLQYTTDVTVANVGQGKWPVPILLVTEDDHLERQVELGPGESKALSLVTQGRPVGFFVDPYGWLPQIPKFDPKTKSVQHARVYIRRVISRLRE